MDIQAKLYRNMKQKNAITIIRVTEKIYAFVLKRFDQFSGEPTAPHTEQVNIDELKAERSNTFTKLQGLDEIISDIEKL